MILIYNHICFQRPADINFLRYLFSYYNYQLQGLKL